MPFSSIDSQDMGARVAALEVTERTAAQIAAKADIINKVDKFVGKLVWDSTGHRLLRARAATDVGVWDVVDGSASVTPA